MAFHVLDKRRKGKIESAKRKFAFLSMNIGHHEEDENGHPYEEEEQDEGGVNNSDSNGGKSPAPKIRLKVTGSMPSFDINLLEEFLSKVIASLKL